MKRRPIFLSHRGFTLMELLATVAIIAVLVGLLVPGVNSVRAASERGKCASNLRTLGGAIHLYAADNGGQLPPGNRVGVGNFGRILSDYIVPMKTPIMSADAFYCPTNIRLGSPPAGGFPIGPGGTGYKGFAGYFFNYLLNASVFPITNSDPTNPAFTPGDQAQVRLSAIQLPTKTVALLDMRTRAPGVTAPPTSGLARNYYFDPKSANFCLGTIHNGLGNILFIDGHIEAFTDSQPLPVNSLPERTTTWWP